MTLVAAILDKYASLTAANFPGGVRPPAYFGKIPETNSGGTQLSAEAGYVLLKDNGSQDTPLAFGRVTSEAAEFEWQIFYPSLEDCFTTAKAIRFNGGTSQQKAGFDGGTLPSLTAPPVVRDIICSREAREMSGRGKTSKRVHSANMRHKFCLTRAS